MPNLNYNRSRAKEYQILHESEKEGKYAVRSAGSHGASDVIALKPAVCGRGDHYEVDFIQIKVSQNLRKVSTTYKIENVPFPINVKMMRFPVKDKQWYEKNKKTKSKSKSKPKKTK